MSKEAKQELAFGELRVMVTSVRDGDTVYVLLDSDNTPRKIRLHGIDAPELDQEYGPESREALATLALNKSLYLDALSYDCYGRIVGVLYEKDWRRSVNKAMIELGMAYDWPRYGRVFGGHNAQKRARSKRLGLWQRFGGEVRPWTHRQGGTQTPIEFTKAKLAEAEKMKVNP